MNDQNFLMYESRIYDEILRAYQQRNGNNLFPFYEIIKLMKLKEDISVGLTQGRIDHILTNSLILLNTLFFHEDLEAQMCVAA